MIQMGQIEERDSALSRADSRESGLKTFFAKLAKLHAQTIGP